MPYGFREEDLSFSHFKSMGANEPRGVANLDPRGMVGRIYVGDHLMLLHTKYLTSEPYGFREEDLSFSHFKSMGANEPRGVANLDPRGMVGRIYVGDHLMLLHTKYLTSEPYGFREDVLSFSLYKSMRANEPQGMASLNPRGMVGRIYVGDHLLLLHT